MRIFSNRQWTISLLVLGVLLAVAVYNGILGGWPSYRISSLVIITAGLWLVSKRQILSFDVISFVIIFVPAFAPLFAFDLMGKEFFSSRSMVIQTDTDLINKCVYLYALAAVAFASVAVPKADNFCVPTVKNTHYPFLVAAFLALASIIAAYVIEPGPTLLTAGYADVLASRFESNALVVFIITSFGGFWVLLFLYGRQHAKLFWLTTFMILLWLTLHSRRVEVMGIMIVFIIWATCLNMARRKIIIMALAFIGLQCMVGETRDSAYLISGNQEMLTSKATHKCANEEWRAKRAGREERCAKKAAIAALSGGVSNVFLAGVLLVHTKDSEEFSFSEHFTMIEWVRSAVPNKIWSLLGQRASRSDRKLIFNRFDLHYSGGMPLLAAFYLNGGTPFVLIFGLFHGFLARRIQLIVGRDLKPNVRQGGTLPLLIVMVFMIYQFRYHWYNPQVPIRGIVFAVFIYIVMTFAMRCLTGRQANKQN